MLPSDGSPPTLLRRAYAKINLALSVGPPLESGPNAGFHPIASWFSCVDLWDDVSITRLPSGSGSRYELAWADDAPRASPIDWSLEKDLGVRAHRLLEEHAEGPLPISLQIRKRIPVGGGLGGGSSDAAAVLAGVSTLFNLIPSTDHLARLGARLGSDIAYFLDPSPSPAAASSPSPPTTSSNLPPRPAFVSGLGDCIERFPPTPLPVLLLIPPVGCPTGPVYKAYDRAPRSLRAADVRAMIARAGSHGQIDPASLFNDLCDPACAVEPRLHATLDRIRQLTDRPVHLTGSGSTLFVLGDPDDGSRSLLSLAANVRRHLPDVACLVTQLV